MQMYLRPKHIMFLGRSLAHISYIHNIVFSVGTFRGLALPPPPPPLHTKKLATLLLFVTSKKICFC